MTLISGTRLTRHRLWQNKFSRYQLHLKQTLELVAALYMDSRAYLTRQGWRGDGHSLDRTDRGISKPLLVSKKVDVLGVGLNKHAAVSDQWWLRAYDQGLKDFGTGTKSALANVQEHGVNRGGLYGRFVKGEGVPGTFGEDSAGSTGDERGTDVPTGQVVDIMAGGKRKREGGLAKKKIARRKTEDKPVTDVHETITTEVDHERTADIDRQANEYVLEAQRLGILSSGPNDTPKTSGANNVPLAAAALPGFAEIVAAVQAKGVGKQSSKKTDKYTREKMKRLMKRTARAYLTGEALEVTESKKKLARKAVKSREAEAGSALSPRAAKGKQSMEKGVSGEARSHVREPRKLSTEKLAEYTKRATEKGISLEAYIARRDEKYAATQAEKRKSGTQPEVRTVEKTAQAEAALSTRPATNATPGETALVAERPLFVVDTAGSDSVMIDANDPDCGAKATSAISRDQKFTIVGAAGTESLTWTPGTAIPLDTRIWTGVTPKELPKIVRKARKDWMAVRREQKKQSKLGVAPDDLAKTSAVKKKARGQLKVEKREAFVRNILLESRKAGAGEGKTATVDGVQDVPLLTVTTDHGAFTKVDVSKARTVARRVLRDEKRAEKAAKGKGKGWKKVQRAAEATEKEVARLAQSMA